MPIILVVLAVVLTAATVWFLTRPLRRAPTAAAGEQRESYQQLSQVRERLLAQLNELDLDAGDHAMDSSVLVDERARLEGELAQVLKRLEETSGAVHTGDAGDPRRGTWLIASIVIALALPLLATGLYGAAHHATLARLGEPASMADSVPPMVREMVTRLERRLQDQPNDAEGWARLARAYEVLERDDEAKQAYQRAHKLAPNNAEILAAYAGMLVAENPAQPSTEAVELFRRLHRMQPQHPGALWVLGLVAFNENKYRQATQYWEILLKQLPPESEVEPQIRQALDVARNRMAPKK